MLLNLAKNKWLLPSNKDQHQNLNTLLKAGKKFSPAFLRLLSNRGYTEIDQVMELINDQPQIFHDPFLLYDMEKAVNRIQSAILKDEQILIYGDYDADGVTSTLIISEGLSILGGRVETYLPNRMSDGYGPNLDRYQEFVQQGIDLIITCDNGVAGHEAIEWAMGQEVDVIVTDHHQIQEEIPKAYAVIHPQHPAGNYPFHDLSGAGVALKLISALLEEVPTEAIELAMIGTIADMVSLTDENRTIVMSGLNLIKGSQRPGLRRLLEVNDINIQEIDEEVIGFILGPRLNAVGRLGDPRPAYDLLKLDPPDSIEDLVTQVNQVNQERQDIVNNILTQVKEKYSKDTLPNIIIDADPDWPAGVLGIVAGRLCQVYHRPVILFQYLASTSEYKGSGRSIPSLNLVNLLTNHQDRIKYYGGHAQAAGLTVTKEAWTSFKNELLDNLAGWEDQFNTVPELKIDLVIKPEELNVDLIQEINQLGPFGIGNEKPLVMIEDISLSNIRFLGNRGQHLKLEFVDPLVEDGPSFQAIGFSLANQARNLQTGQIISLVGYLHLNHFRNQIQPQLLVEDLGIRGCQWIDFRSSQVQKEIFAFSQSLYVFRQKQLAEIYEKHLLPGATTYILGDELSIDGIDELKSLIIFQPPQSFDNLEKILSLKEWDQIILGSYIGESKYLVGLPTYDEIKRLFLWQVNQTRYEVRPALSKICQQLGLSSTKVKLILVMFLEAGFVTIKDGWIDNLPYDKKKKIDLLQLPAYLKYKEAMEVEALLNFQPIQKIKEHFERKNI